MSGSLGLIELVLVFAAVAGFGIWELRSVRRATRDAERRKDGEGR